MSHDTSVHCALKDTMPWWTMPGSHTNCTLAELIQPNHKNGEERWVNKTNTFLLWIQTCLGLKSPQYLMLSLYMEKAMAPHSSTLAWKIPWTEEPGRLQSMGSWRVGHNWATSLSLFTFMHWRRKWQPTPVFLPGESQGRRRLVGCCLWGRTESDLVTEAT